MARMQMQRRLSDAVLELDEPYRSTIILRFLDEMSYAQIATRQSISQAAVRQRVSRGLSQLRERLEHDFGGDRSAMCLALVHFWRGNDAALAAVATGSALPLGGLALGTKIQLSLALTLLLALGAWYTQSRAETENPPEMARVEVREELEAPPTEVVEPSTENRQALSAPETIDEPVEVAASTLIEVDRERDLHGRVLNDAGEPLEGAQVKVSKRPARTFDVLDLAYVDRVTEELSTTTDARGEFRLRLPLGSPYEVVVSKEGFAATRAGARQAGEYLEVRLSAGSTLRGRVTAAEDGAPVPNCLLIGKLLEDPETEVFQVRTDEGGRYSVSGLQAADLWLEVRPVLHDHIYKISLVLPAEGELVHDIEVTPGHVVYGQVTDARTGQPLAGVLLGEGWTLSRTV
ncbi:MAG: carboxypeptidase regulatory-like domain-containing protein, partial [Planctomycetota bacterium]